MSCSFCELGAAVLDPQEVVWHIVFCAVFSRIRVRREIHTVNDRTMEKRGGGDVAAFTSVGGPANVRPDVGFGSPGIF